MQVLIDALQSADSFKIAFPALAGIVVWFFNKRSKLKWEQFKRKEERYKELLRCLKGFYVSTHDKELKGQFLHQVNLLWLYAPDQVIQVAYSCLEKVKTGASSPDNERELACGALDKSVRKDLLSRRIVKGSMLNAKNFRHFVAT